VYDVQLSCTLFVFLKYSVFCPENVLARSAVVFVTSVLEVHDVIALYKFCISLFILLPFPLDILAVQLTYGRHNFCQRTMIMWMSEDVCPRQKS